MARRILIVSPIPSEPRNQGNSARIAVMGEVLQAAGWIVHFLYHKLEGLTPSQAAAMAACWDHFHVLDGPPCPPKAAGGAALALDDWYDPALSDFAASLQRRWRFAAVIANYVWCSAVLEAFDGSVVKVLDTHDVFGGRDRRFRELGLEPAWYYTTPAEEARGLARADIVLAIQPEEADLFRALGHPDVRTLGHLLPCRRTPPRAQGGCRPSAGYLASANPLNLAAFAKLQAAIRVRPGRQVGRWVLAGTICTRVPDAAPFDALGPVSNTDRFYDSVDLVLNPMAGGTGLKIKSVEAVHLGLPLIATAAAMAGLPATHPAHHLADANEVVDYVQGKRWTAAALAGLHRASEMCAREYSDGVRGEYRRLVGDVLRR